MSLCLCNTQTPKAFFKKNTHNARFLLCLGYFITLQSSEKHNPIDHGLETTILKVE